MRFMTFDSVEIMDRVKLNGATTFAFKSRNELIEHIDINQKILIAVNTEKILENDQRLKEIINDNIGYADGIGAVMALKRKGFNAVKIPGSELWLDILNKYNSTKKIYLLGSTEDVIKLTFEKLCREYPDNRIVGFRNGFFSDEEWVNIKETIIKKKADIIFVAMGSPKQEYLMAEMFKEYPALYMGLGGSFDLYCGKAKPVPGWWKKVFKWEGFYRAINEKRDWERWKRQVKTLRILYRILLNKI